MHIESRPDLHIHKLSCCSLTILLIICRFLSLEQWRGEVSAVQGGGTQSRVEGKVKF